MLKPGSQKASYISCQAASGNIRQFTARLPKYFARPLLAIAAAGLFSLTPAQAAIFSTGDVLPASDPSTWTNGASGTTAYIGSTGNGALTVEGGSSMTAYTSYIGNNAGSGGSVTVSGPGSTWVGNSTIYNGYGGAGSMTINNGGVIGAKDAFFGYNTGVNGNATVGGAGSALNVTYGLELGYSGSGTLNVTNGGYAGASRLRLGTWSGATGTVNVSDAGSKLALINIPTNNYPHEIGYHGNGAISIKNGASMESVGSVHLAMNVGTSGTISVDGVGSTWNGTALDGGLSIGQDGNGTLNITNGGKVITNVYGMSIADNPTTTGTVNVSGSGSAWSVTAVDAVYISRMGKGTLNITNGGKVDTSSKYMYVGLTNSGGGSGSVIVNGAGSSWSHTGLVNLGFGMAGGAGRLVIGDGGAVNASSMLISANSMVTADVSRGSSLTLGNGTGTLTNNGTIRLVAGAGAANGTYTPISAAWSGSGAVQALGGIWNSTNHTVTVSSAATGATGTALTADLANTQRFLFTDDSTGKSVGAAFQATAASANLTMKATGISGSELTSLQSFVGPGQTVLSGWDFTTDGYTTGNPVYLSLFAGSGHSLSDLNIWHYDGSEWAKFAASDLAYNNTYASFTATGFSGYAVSGAAPVPVPAAIWLLGSGLIGLTGIRRRKIA